MTEHSSKHVICQIIHRFCRLIIEIFLTRSDVERMLAGPMFTETDKRHSVVEAVRALDEKGFNHGSSGNVSIRCESGLLITPTGGRAASLTPEAIVRLDFDGQVDGPGTPSSEWRLHAEILRRRPEIEAVARARRQSDHSDEVSLVDVASERPAHIGAVGTAHGKARAGNDAGLAACRSGRRQSSNFSVVSALPRTQ
ncbi:class II aldolase/adducin family protein [Jiella endophytica]|uniref:Class II aldolase/adducin family protein n=1 Tax=Jiella endophytica TaxID=2558362 RepID=A0A4Y8RTM2_9HYPH|nr:class II aldolase/adducin family protein [Jiella endophytica]TFF27576.1 class II aldolase/adducin family protein [Jiella endophytica]